MHPVLDADDRQCQVADPGPNEKANVEARKHQKEVEGIHVVLPRPRSTLPNVTPNVPVQRPGTARMTLALYLSRSAATGS